MLFRSVHENDARLSVDDDGVLLGPDRFSRHGADPDPVVSDLLLFLYRYDDPLDREIAGLVASSLAYGRIAQILKSVSRVLDPLGPSPATI